uniref:FLO1 weakly flocculating variant n=1 Tax=Saccharomyces cerevisiae TaxID=4932 RepID=A0A088DP69_YEASX|nr:FLO1 weakly flocculating variant [Saccharomyces cerevisiae]
MTMPHRYMFLAVFTLLALTSVASGATEACLPAGQRKSGMNINFYQYSLKDSSTYSNAAYMAYGYASKTKLGSVGGQTDISIDYNIPCVSSSGTFPCPQEDSYGNWGCKGMGACSNSQGIAYWSTDLFGFYTTPTNVTLEMTGYFLPPQTGSYTFKFATVDDSAILSVGGATAFNCCAQQQPPITSTNFTIDGIKPWGGSLPPNIEGTVYMYAGYYYPMKVVYSNAVSWGTLPISVTLPDGTTVSDDFEGYVYSFDDDLSQSNCTVPDPSNYAVSTTTTTTEPWTGTFTSTSTEMTTVTGTNGVPTDETVIVIRTPTSEGLISTTTEPWTGTFTSTSTEMTTVTGTNGQPTDETVIVIRTPTSEGLISTTTEPWTGTFTSTSTEVTTITGTNGQPTDETVIVIRTPTSEGLISTTTEPWTGTFTSTSTEMTTVTGTNGQPTDETVIVIRTPTSEGLVTTTTEPWTGTFTSTSTEMSTVTGTNGLPTDETVIVVKTPTTAISSSLSSSSSGQITSSITSSRPIITPFYPSNGTSVISSSVISSSVTSSLFTSSPVISSSVISSSTTTSTSIFSESSKSSVIPTSSSTSGSSESETSSAGSVSSSSFISSESSKSPTYSSSSLPLVTSATTSQETASSLPPATTTKTSEQTTLVTVTSCESHVCTESISPAIVSTATVTVSGVTTEYTTWCPISTTETTKQTKGTTEQTTETTKQTTVVTISSCESDVCSKTASPAIVSTSTATINGVTTEYTTWCPISTTESRQQTTLVTVTSCESGVCSETASPAIVSTATATVNDVVTVYPTWRPQTANEESVSSKMNSATGETTTNTLAAETTTNTVAAETITNTGAAETKTVVTSSLSRSNHAETQTASATDVIGHSSSVVSVSETGNTKSLTSSGLSTMSQQPRSTPASSMVGYSTASLEISTYAGSANSLLAGSGLSVFIASLLLAII